MKLGRGEERGPAGREQSEQMSRDVAVAAALQTEVVQQELSVATGPIGMVLLLRANEAFLLNEGGSCGLGGDSNQVPKEVEQDAGRWKEAVAIAGVEWIEGLKGKENKSSGRSGQRSLETSFHAKK